MDKYSVTYSGVNLGAVIAVVVSWSVNHSIGWAILHGMISWFYVIYRLIVGGY